jgi:hypothetical protein
LPLAKVRWRRGGPHGGGGSQGGGPGAIMAEVLQCQVFARPDFAMGGLRGGTAFRDGWTAWRRRASRNPAAPRNAVLPWEAGAPERRFTVGRQRQIRGSVPSRGARVLEVRIHLPPAESRTNFGTRLTAPGQPASGHAAPRRTAPMSPVLLPARHAGAGADTAQRAGEVCRDADDRRIEFLLKPLLGGFAGVPGDSLPTMANLSWRTRSDRVGQPAHLIQVKVSLVSRSIRSLHIGGLKSAVTKTSGGAAAPRHY